MENPPNFDLLLISGGFTVSFLAFFRCISCILDICKLLQIIGHSLLLEIANYGTSLLPLPPEKKIGKNYINNMQNIAAKVL